MHLFDPLRPTLAPNRPALLLEGSAIPVISIVPRHEADNIPRVALVVYLRNFGENSERAYSYCSKVIYTEALSEFFWEYTDDPEGALKTHFGWIDQRCAALPRAPSARAQPSASTMAAAQEAIDLL